MFFFYFLITSIAAWLFIATASEIELYTDYIDDEILTSERAGVSADHVAAFYHIYTSTNRHAKVVQEQIAHMKKSGLMPHISSVHYTVLGNRDFDIPDKKFHKSQHIDRGTETNTHAKLYQYCRENPLHKVLYFHTKGISEHVVQPVYETHRQILNAFTLNTACISILDDFDTCGWRISPLPFVHYSGNFWWARCSYINTLVDPALLLKGSLLQTITIRAFEPTVKKASGCLGLDDFFPEAWIGSAPRLNAADCIGDVSPGYLFSSSIPADIAGLADMINKQPSKHDLKCGLAGTNSSFETFQKSFDREIKVFPCAHIYNFTSRSMLWYNEPPYSLIDWRARYGDKMPADVSSLHVHPDIRAQQLIANLDYSFTRSQVSSNVNRYKPSTSTDASNPPSGSSSTIGATSISHTSPMSGSTTSSSGSSGYHGPTTAASENEALKTQLQKYAEIVQVLTREVKQLRGTGLQSLHNAIERPTVVSGSHELPQNELDETEYPEIEQPKSRKEWKAPPSKASSSWPEDDIVGKRGNEYSIGSPKKIKRATNVIDGISERKSRHRKSQGSNSPEEPEESPDGIESENPDDQTSQLPIDRTSRREQRPVRRERDRRSSDVKKRRSSFD